MGIKCKQGMLAPQICGYLIIVMICGKSQLDFNITALFYITPIYFIVKMVLKLPKIQ